MASKLEDALQKVTALPGVKAALVFDHFNTVVARDVPGQYSNDILKRIAGQLSQLAQMSAKSRVQTQEFRLVYDKYAVYVRLFAKNFYLVVFMDRDLQSADFRQPLNLSVLVLDRALRSEELYEAGRTMSNAAQLAEGSLADSYESDVSFAGRFRKLCVTFLGQAGRDLVDHSMEELYIFPPIRTEGDMHKLRELALTHVIHPAKRALIAKESMDLLGDCTALG
jgi:predicted regulator of Ras-like GTPase activity (Roadblock/LC7/MglB family)